MDTRWIPAAEWGELAASLKASNWWLADLCGLDRVALDRVDEAEHRFEVVVQLLHHAQHERATIHIVAEGEPPSVPSVTDQWPAAAFMEREAFDMLGIVFAGHPNLTRILMPDEWEGHPLRKDYGVGKVAVQFRAQPLLQIDAPGQAPASRDAGSAVDGLGQSEASRE